MVFSKRREESIKIGTLTQCHQTVGERKEEECFLFLSLLKLLFFNYQEVKLL